MSVAERFNSDSHVITARISLANNNTALIGCSLKLAEPVTTPRAFYSVSALGNDADSAFWKGD